MADRSKARKDVAQKISKLDARIKLLIEKGLPFHREAAEFQTIIANEWLLRKGRKLDDNLAWFLDALDPNDMSGLSRGRTVSFPGSSMSYRDMFDPYKPPDLGSMLLYGATVFSHVKSVQYTDSANWVSLTEGLMLGLLLTDLKGTTGADVNMPLPSFIIEIPPGTIFAYDDHTGWHETKYIIVSEAISPDFGESLFLYVWSQPNENSINVFDDHAEYFPLDISYKSESLEHVFQIYEQLRTEEIRKFGSAFTRDARGKIFGEEYYGPDLREKLIRIVINTIIYMTSAGAVVEHENQKEIDRLLAIQDRRPLKLKERMQLGQLEQDPHYILGTDIKITHKDIEAIEQAQKEDRKKESSGRKLKHPSITRGHWRWQAHGPGRSLRKRIWIRPFIRGKELGGQVAGHTYTLENPFGSD